jgi:hypothetical protein
MLWLATYHLPVGDKLLEMIKEIDKICPEEGMLDIAVNNQDPINSQDPQALSINLSNNE